MQERNGKLVFNSFATFFQNSCFEASNAAHHTRWIRVRSHRAVMLLRENLGMRQAILRATNRHAMHLDTALFSRLRRLVDVCISHRGRQRVGMISSNDTCMASFAPNS